MYRYELPPSDTTHALFTISGTDLSPDVLTRRLGIVPHRQHQQGDRYLGRDRDGRTVLRTKSLGLWGLDSTRILYSENPALHVHALLDQLSPRCLVINQLIDEGLSCGMWVHRAHTVYDAGWDMDAGMLAKLAELGVWVAMGFKVIP